ncbi:MAG: hypothetical protein M1840_002055 [Geoglossum simile]|nr:MAG: hypothetical protein M1840_002055 [Geoglossum simile]
MALLSTRNRTTTTELVRNERVRGGLASVIIPSRLQHAPCLPNLFTEGKGPNGSAVVAKRQACYDGALGARGIHMLQSHGRDEATYDNDAYTISATYHHDGLLKINARDWAKEQRDKLITVANGRVVDMPIETSTFESSSNGMLSLSTIEPTLHESDTSADELALGMSNSVPLPPKRLKGGPENCHSEPDQKRHLKASSSKAGRRSRGEVAPCRSKTLISTE